VRDEHFSFLESLRGEFNSHLRKYSTNFLNSDLNPRVNGGW